MKAEKANIGIITALSSMDEGQLSAFLGDYEPIPCEAVNDARAERIRELTLKKINIGKSITRLRWRRALTAVLVAALAVAMLVLGVIGGAMLGDKKSDSMEEAPGDAGDKNQMLFYDTYESIDELCAWLDLETADDPLDSRVWLSENGVPIITSFASPEDCRFGLYYNCIEVIFDNEELGNGYMVYLLDEEYTDVKGACLSVGINIEASYNEGQYSEGQVLVNGEVCEGIVTAGEGNRIYYILHGNALYLISAPSSQYVSDLSVEYVK